MAQSGPIAGSQARYAARSTPAHLPRPQRARRTPADHDERPTPRGESRLAARRSHRTRVATAALTGGLIAIASSPAADADDSLSRTTTSLDLSAGTAAAPVVPGADSVAGVSSDPLIVLADSLQVLGTRAARARRDGDLGALEAAVASEQALLPAVARALERRPLPGARTLARASSLALAARLLRAERAGAWIDSMRSRAARLATDDPDRLTIEFMVGLALSGTRDVEAAVGHFERAAASELLGPEARLRAARALHRLGREAEADERRRRALALLDGVTDAGPLAAATDLLAVQIACGTLETPAAVDDCIGRAERWIKRRRTDASQPVVLLLLAEAHEAAGEFDDAERSCLDLLARHPRSAQAREAWARYLGLRKARGRQPEARARYLAAAALAARGERRDAARELDLLLADENAADHHVRARLLLGQMLRRLGRYDRAIEVLAGVKEAPATVRQRYEADLWSGRALWSAGRIDEARDRYAELAAAARGARQGVLAGWELGRMLEDEGRLGAAREAFASFARRHPRNLRAAEAAWRGGLCAYRLGQLEDAATAFARSMPAAQPADRERRLYWLGRVLDDQGRAAEALRAFDEAAAVWPRDYYGWRAASRLDLVDGTDDGLPVRLAGAAGAAGAAPGAVVPPDVRRISGLTRQARRSLDLGLLLLDLGLEESARRELRTVEREIDRDPGALLALAEAYVAHGVYDRAVSCGWDARQATLRTPAELAALRYLYPIAFPEHVFGESRRRGVDPLLALALMRRESRFHPGARSRAGARGLMQLMPRTAAGVAREMRLSRPRLGDLYRPQINVQLGTWYLASVLRGFEGRPELALASYNAGRTKVEEWRRSLAVDDPDLFVELVGYKETRDYIKKVLNDYFYYQVVYRHPPPP